MRTERSRWPGSISLNVGLMTDPSPDKRKKGTSLKQAQERFTLLGYPLPPRRID